MSYLRLTINDHAAGLLLLAIGRWLLAVGCWLLAVSYWLLAVGRWLLAVNNFVVELWLHLSIIQARLILHSVCTNLGC